MMPKKSTNFVSTNNTLPDTTETQNSKINMANLALIESNSNLVLRAQTSKNCSLDNWWDTLFGHLRNNNVKDKLTLDNQGMHNRIERESAGLGDNVAKRARFEPNNKMVESLVYRQATKAPVRVRVPKEDNLHWTVQNPVHVLAAGVPQTNPEADGQTIRGPNDIPQDAGTVNDDTSTRKNNSTNSTLNHYESTRNAADGESTSSVIGAERGCLNLQFAGISTSTSNFPQVGLLPKICTSTSRNAEPHGVAGATTSTDRGISTYEIWNDLCQQIPKRNDCSDKRTTTHPTSISIACHNPTDNCQAPSISLDNSLHKNYSNEVLTKNRICWITSDSLEEPDIIMALPTLERCRSLKSTVHTTRVQQCDGQRRSKAIAIQKKIDAIETEQDRLQDISSAENLYDMATWRMYNRIVEYRTQHPLPADYYQQSSETTKVLRNDHNLPPSCLDGARTTLSDGQPYDGEVFELDI